VAASSTTSTTDPVNWDVVLRVTRQLLGRRPTMPPSTRRELEESFAFATERAERLVELQTGLRSAAGPARCEVVDRARWVEANVSSFRRLLAPIGERLANGSAAARRALSPASRVAAGVEVGGLLTWMSGRVLGQYDLLLAEGADEGDVVYFVGENIAQIEREHHFPADQFRLWIALHEVTHRLQFTGVPWMRPYFLGLVERGVQTSPPDAKALLDSLRRAAAEIRAGRNPLAESGVIGLIATTDQLATLRDAQALMSLLEGHGDVVMGRAAGPQIPEASRFAATLQQRRASAKGAAKVLQQLVGVESKLRQYAEGEAFVEAVSEAGGDALVARLWESPAMLPTLEEIRDPARWIARVAGDRPPAEVGPGTSSPR
jgi:coenzyme F420 biosynthesis associated uncharacterized protein